MFACKQEGLGMRLLVHINQVLKSVLMAIQVNQSSQSQSTHLLAIATLSKDSVDAVEEMLKKQEDFEKMLTGQEEKFHMLIRETKVKTILPL